MTNPALLIYDNTGRVWAVFHGETTVPAGVQGIIADAPTSFKTVTVDVTTKTAKFELGEDPVAEVSNLQDAIIELEERVNALEGN